MNVRNNKRGMLYKDKLKSALLHLLEKDMNIEQITVKAICEEANVNRSTFYSHYFIPTDILDEIEDETLLMTSIYLKEITHVSFDSLSILLEYIKEHDDVFRVLFLYTKDQSYSFE